MNGKSSTVISGVVAVGIYFVFVSLLLVYFNTRNTQKYVHYVKKNENRIRVSVGGPKENVKKKKTAKPEAHKKSIKKKKVPTKERVKKQKDTRKKVIKEKVVKKVPKKSAKKEALKKEPVKKVNKPKDLFASVSTKKEPINKKPEKKKIIKNKDVNQKKARNTPKEKSASELFSESLKVQKRSDSGIENAYLAEIEEKLKGWPAQSDYAGQKVKVWIKVETDGMFTFKIRSASSNDDFNQALIIYLEQLQKFGFGPHKGNRAYEIDVSFIAKD